MCVSKQNICLGILLVRYAYAAIYMLYYYVLGLGSEGTCQPGVLDCCQ
jgi:hypothetical protein